MLLTVLLILSLFLLFYSLTVGEYPDSYSLREKLIVHGTPILGSITMFVITLTLFKTPVAALCWAILGWFLPGWIIKSQADKKQARLRDLAKDYVTSAAGLYAVGQTNADVIRIMSERFPEPFATEFRDMLAIRVANPQASVPKMFAEMGHKYNLSELKAVSAILSASERAGGPYAAAKGFKRLGRALRLRDKLMTERIKETMQPKIAAYVVIAILSGGLLLDATALSSLFDGPGKLVMAVSSAIVVGLIFMVNKIARSDDLV